MIWLDFRDEHRAKGDELEPEQISEPCDGIFRIFNELVAGLVSNVLSSR